MTHLQQHKVLACLHLLHPVFLKFFLLFPHDFLLSSINSCGTGTQTLQSLRILRSLVRIMRTTHSILIIPLRVLNRNTITTLLSNKLNHVLYTRVVSSNLATHKTLLSAKSDLLARPSGNFWHHKKANEE